MTEYNIINDLTKGKFYSGGKIYIKLNIMFKYIKPI